MSKASTSYLNEPGRLPDVLAAIQSMAAYKFYKLSFEAWADRISGDGNLADHWRTVFEDHPEFFRLDRKREKASLVWRRQTPKRFHVDRQRLLSHEEFYALPDSEKDRVSRSQLSTADIQALMATAVELHARQVELRKERRWWIPLLTAAAGLIGGLVGALLG
jgi:hypothetical protein